MDQLLAMKTFLAVADARGFAPAARKLKLSPSAVTRLIASLEDHLDAQLLHRTTRSVTLTDAGVRFLERTRRILADVDEAELSAKEERAKPVGKLTVTAPMVFGRLHVGPLLGAYLREYPGVTAELRLTDRYVGLVEEGIDVAIRIGPLTDSSLVVRRAGETRRVLVAAPSYLEKHPRLARPDQLKKMDLISVDSLTPAPEWRFEDDGRAMRVTVTPRYSTNSVDDAIWQAIHGGGISTALSYQVLEHVRAEKLRIVLAKYEPPPLPIQVVYPASRLLSSKVRALIDLISRTCRWNF